MNDHITVCICTFKRPRFLQRLLQELANQETEGRFTYSIVVADNDCLQSAKSIARKFERTVAIPIRYCVEPQQNIALTRNKAIDNARGNLIAFIDDDEYPIGRWLLTLFEAYERYGVDGVLGPVKPEFECDPPKWVVKGRFYDRPTYPTGFIIDWRKGRTGNVLLNKAVFPPNEPAFRSDLLTGEDQDFFRRMIQKGHTFVWCDEAVAYEIVPATRWRRSFLIRRALLRGKVSLAHPTSRLLEVAKSIIAVAAYVAALPIMLMFGQGLFMRYLIKIFDHAGKLLALIRIYPVKDIYVTE